MKLITARLFTFVRKDGIIGSIELYINESGTFGYRMWNSLGHETIRKDFDDATEAMNWYNHTISLFKDYSKRNTNLKSWKEVK